jgi:hypothetical protein
MGLPVSIEIAAYRLGKGVFETYRCKPFNTRGTEGLDSARVSADDIGPRKSLAGSTALKSRATAFAFYARRD